MSNESIDLIAMLFDHECQAGMSLDTRLVTRKVVDRRLIENDVLCEQYSLALAETENVKHGHVAFVSQDNPTLSLKKVFV